MANWLPSSLRSGAPTSRSQPTAKKPARKPRNFSMSLQRVVTTVIETEVKDGEPPHTAAKAAYSLLAPKERRPLLEQML